MNYWNTFLLLIQKAISFVFPLLKEKPSDYNGIVEITWFRGKKRLDSENTNYSFGSLQKVLSYGISHIKLNHTQEVLVLGLGGGSVLFTLREKFNYHGKITAIELDKEIIKIAKEDFNLDKINNLLVYHGDAYKHVQEDSKTYGLIIVDLFIDNKVPPLFYSRKFWQRLHLKLNEGGTILFNAGVQKVGKNKFQNKLYPLRNFYAKHFNFRELIHPSHANQLFILQHRKEKIKINAEKGGVKSGIIGQTPLFCLDFLNIDLSFLIF